MTAASDANDKTPVSRNGKILPRLIFVGVVAALGLGGGAYWLSVRGTETTDDAFTDGRSATIAPKISGYVTALKVNDNSRVKAGQVLLEIDPRDYVIAHDRAVAALALDEAQLDSARTNLAIAEVKYPAERDSARAAVESAKANLARAKADFERQHKVDIRATTEQQIDASLAAMRTAQASLSDAEAKLKTAELVTQNIAAAAAQVKQLEALVNEAKSDLAQTEVNLSNTKIVAPFDGWVTKRNVEQGSYLQVGQALFSLVSPEVWVTANFKESQLTDMKPGQKVAIRLDAYPDLKISGHVDSIQMGSGARFTAFPAENATGNFVKIVQRVPVKIVLDSGIDIDHPLPLGLSADPVVSVR